jgi:predicted O-linked N-acetylglucosamine transferase (SPINDLY family)
MKLAIFDPSWEYTLNTPYDEPLGGTQSAICYFLEEMALRGHQVFIFNKKNNNNIEIIRGVIHVNVNMWFEYIKKNNLIFDLIIVSCIATELLQIKMMLNENKTMFGLWTGHDIDQEASKILKDKKNVDLVDLFIFVSDWQRLRYVEHYNVPYNKTLILRNGIGKPFEKYLNTPIKKDKNSMTYCSIPWRGLELLIPIFKNIKQLQPNATLKIFSGMNIYKQEERPGLFDEFKKMESVSCNHGVSQTVLANELAKIEYLSYPNIFQETSCITVLQAMACGCLIVTSDLGALKETMNSTNEYVNINIHNFNAEEYVIEFIKKQLNLMKTSEKNKEVLRKQNREYIKKNYLYSVICSKFEKDIEIIFKDYQDYVTNKYNNLLINFVQLFSEEKLVDSIIASRSFKYYTNINDYYIIKLNSGVCFYKIGKLNEAKDFFKVAKKIKEDFNVNKNIALLELQRNNIDKFIKYAKKAITYDFDPLIANLIAEKYESLGQHHEAIGLYQSIIDIQPDNINCLNNLGNLHLINISDIPDFEFVMSKTYGKSLEYAQKYNENRKKELILSNIIFNNLYNWKLTDEEIFKRSCVWYKYFPKDLKLVNIVNKLDRSIIHTNRKIRIGYISTDFITHPVGYMFDSILKNHNTAKFEIFCYDNSNQERAKNDLMANKLRSYNNASWYIIENKSDEEVLEQMITDNLDILVDMMGHTRNTRINLIQYKPARIIISYFAYPATNGMNEVDYRFTDKYVTPPECQQYFVEKLWYLPNGMQCYSPPVEIDATKNYTRDKYKLHLCCFNNPIKLSKPTIAIFAEVLKKLPEAKLFLRYCYYQSSYVRQRILKQFVELGIEKERIDICNLDLIESLKFYNMMDIALDPFPYNGGTISSESLYMGTPLVTLKGTTYVSRVGVSLLSNLGLEKYIANDKDEYVQKVIDLARNTTELRELHQSLRLRMLNSDLANPISFTHNIEKAYDDMIVIFNNKTN